MFREGIANASGGNRKTAMIDMRRSESHAKKMNEITLWLFPRVCKLLHCIGNSLLTVAVKSVFATTSIGGVWSIFFTFREGIANANGGNRKTAMIDM